MDGSVVNVGLPAIGRDLQAGAGALQWVVNAYLLLLSTLLFLLATMPLASASLAFPPGRSENSLG